MKKPKVVFCWSEISGYMSACFRELSQSHAVDAFFIAFSSGTAGSGGQFSNALVDGFPCHLLDEKDRNDGSIVEEIIFSQLPDVIVLCGWFHHPYRKLIAKARLKGIKIIMAIDTPWWGRPKQWVGRIVLRRLMKSIDLVFVTGERSWQYAIRLGVAQSKIRRGMYGVDHSGLSECYDSRIASSQWPRSFLFSGRYAKEKAIDLLVAGYADYRRQMIAENSDPWPLICCGNGPLKNLIEDAGTIENRGFVQPEKMRDVLRHAGVVVLASTYDPWPLAIVEACAAGLPVIASEACGSSVELVRSEFNGYPIPTGSAAALATAMCRAHRNYGNLAAFGKRSNELAAAYSAEVWRQRFVDAILGLVNGSQKTDRSRPCAL